MQKSPLHGAPISLAESLPARMESISAVQSCQRFVRYGHRRAGSVSCSPEFQAMEKLKPDATGIYVAAHQAPGAIEEAIEAEVPLIVAVAEHIPIHDIMRVNSKSM